MEAITLKLDRRKSKSTDTLQKISFIAAGLIFILDVLELPPASIQQIFRVVYFYAYLIAGAANIAAAVFYTKIKLGGLSDNIVRWLNAVSGLLLIVDAFYKFLLGKTAIPAALFAAGILYLLVFLFWKKLKQKISVTITDEYITFRKRQFKKTIVPFSSLSKATLNNGLLELSLHTGKNYKLFIGNNDETLLEFFKQRIDDLNKRVSTN